MRPSHHSSHEPDEHGDDHLRDHLSGPGSVSRRAREASDHARERALERAHDVRERAQEATTAVREKVEEVKPKLRGWLHTAIAPLTLAAGIVLVALSPTVTTRVGSTVFAATALLLFTVSAIYHRGTWSPRTHAFLRRFDHSNIFLLIAGSYTPFTLILLEGRARLGLLLIVWIGAVLGVVFKLFWLDAPRWLHTPVYFALGWAAIFYADEFADGGTAVIALVAVGGGLYTLGGLVYGLQWPDPSPRWFGFHEIFHAFTIAAFVCHYVAASIATYSLR